MPHGYPDFGVELEGLSPVLDLAELAARLLSGAGGLYRGGNVIFSTVMQNGLGAFPTKTLSGGAAKIALNSKYADYGPACVALTCQATIGNTTILGRDIAANYVGKIGAEISVLFLTDVSVRCRLRLTSIYLSGVKHQYELRINYDSATDKIDLDYLNSSNAYTDWQDLGVHIFGRGFTSFKLVVDNTTEGSPLYDHVTVNGKDYTFSSVAGYKPAAAAASLPVTQLEIINEALAAAARIFYVGLCIFTVNEP